MNAINASEATLHAVAEAFKLAALLDPRVPHADKASLAAQAEQVQRHNFSDADLDSGILLEAVRQYNDQPQDRPPGIGDLIYHARAIRQDRRLREDTAAEAAAGSDPQAAATLLTAVTEVAETKSIPDHRHERPTGPSPRSVPCPHCHAGAGQPCYNSATRRAFNGNHHARVDAAAARNFSPARSSATVIVADRQCPCGRDILNDTDTTCDRCTPVVNGPSHSATTIKKGDIA